MEALHAPTRTIAIAATFTAEPLEDPLTFWWQSLNVPAQVEFAPYNQVFQQLLDPASLLGGNQRGANVVLLRLEDWQGQGSRDDGSLDGLRRNLDDFAGAVREAAARFAVPLLVVVCPPSPDVLRDAQSRSAHAAAEADLRRELATVSGVHLLDPWDLAARYPVTDYHDRVGEQVGHVPYTPLAFTALATLLARMIHALIRAPYKVMVLDSDQTLWKGVVGEDGPDGIRVDPPRVALQRLLLDQRAAGMLLCLCSKNVEQDIEAVFECGPDMPLKREHLVSWRVNWHAKSANLKELAGELGLGLDSFIFIDDNPLECAEMRSHCPDVLTLQLPQDEEGMARFLNHVWAFDHPKITEEDARRSDMYRANVERERVRESAGSYAGFLESLELEVDVTEPGPAHLPRVAQLTQRTNQFNTTTVRRTEQEIEAFRQVEHRGVRVVHVRDRFGDYGLVGAALFEVAEETLWVDSLLLSCRALGRGVEHHVMRHLGDLARAEGCHWVSVEFRPSERNQPARDFLESLLADEAGSRRHETDDGVRYDYLADHAQRVGHHPVSEAEGSPGSSSAVESAEPGNGAMRPPSCLARIHEDLCRVEQILDASREMRRRAGPESRSGADPEGSTEQALAEIWQNLLGVRDIGRSDDFFDLGGTSVVAVSLLSEIERTFGRDLTLEHLVDTSDLAGLACLIENPDPSGGDVPSVLVPLQPHGSKTPYFAVHGAYGHVLGFVHLARALGADQPFYGLQPAGLVPGWPVDRSVPIMAEHYLDAIRQVQPHGPYRLLGKCFGSLVALDIAQRLEDAGETVEFLGLVDPPRASRNSWATLTRIRAGYYYQHYLRQPLQRPLQAMTRHGPLELVEVLVGKVRHGGGPHRARMRRAADSRRRPAGPTASPGRGEAPSRTWQRRRQALVFEANLVAQQTYHAEAYAGRVALILAGRAPRTYDVAGWSALVQDGVQVRVIPGHKRDIMSPANARSLAECVRAAAQAADPRV